MGWKGKELRSIPKQEALYWALELGGDAEKGIKDGWRFEYHLEIWVESEWREGEFNVECTKLKFC